MPTPLLTRRNGAGTARIRRRTSGTLNNPSEMLNKLLTRCFGVASGLSSPTPVIVLYASPLRLGGLALQGLSPTLLVRCRRSAACPLTLLPPPSSSSSSSAGLPAPATPPISVVCCRRPQPHDAGGVDCVEGRCTTRHFTFDRMLWGCFRASSACQLPAGPPPLPPPPHAARRTRTITPQQTRPPCPLNATTPSVSRPPHAWGCRTTGGRTYHLPLCQGCRAVRPTTPGGCRGPSCTGLRAGALWLRVRRGPVCPAQSGRSLPPIIQVRVAGWPQLPLTPSAALSRPLRPASPE